MMDIVDIVIITDIKINGGLFPPFSIGGYLMEGKICSKCGEFKSYSEFNKTKQNKDGYNGQCKQCKKEYHKKYDKQYRDSHKEEIRERKKQYYQSNKEELNEKQKQYRNSHKQQSQQYRDSHKEEKKKYDKQYRDSNKERLKKYDKQRRQDSKDKNIMMINELIKNIEKYNLINKHNIPIHGYIYKIENIKTGRVYIGQTIQPLTKRYKSNNIIGYWINERIKYDKQKFKDELLNINDFKLTEILDIGICKYHLDKLEVYYINLYDSYNNGYNNQNGNHNTDDGIVEFKEILQYYNINESELIWRV